MKQLLPQLPPPAAQRGFSLIAVMIIMVIVSLLGVGASQLVLLGERSARYDRDWQIAYQAAEAALMDAEFDIRGPNNAPAPKNRTAEFSSSSVLGFFDNCGTTQVDRGLCFPSVGTKPVYYTVDFLDKSATSPSVEFGEFTDRKYPVVTVQANSARLPRYIIEAIPDMTPGYGTRTPRVLHRVTAMGFGPSEQTQAVLQMVFRKE